MAEAGADGVLPVDKPRGPTSHDVVARARRSLGTRRIGHTGTLDPFASGLLLLCVGRATRIAEYLTGLDKSYVAVARLGVAMDTDDVTGSPLAESDAWRELGDDTIREAVRSLEGPQMQVPPAYSAKKVGGERMYRAARRGEPLEVPAVEVTVHHIEVTALRPPDIELEVDCSSGTYIRALARDLGERLGVGAYLAALRRTRIGELSVDDAIPVDAVDDPEAVRGAWLSPAQALRHLPGVDVDERRAAEIGHGGPVIAPEGTPDTGTVVVTAGGELIAMADVVAGMLRPRKVFT